MPTLWFIVGILNLCGTGFAFILGAWGWIPYMLISSLVCFTVACIIQELRSIREAIERSRDQQALSDDLGGPRWVTTQKN